MAEADDTGIEALIRQRCSRPSFARMISWEILKSSENEPARKSNRSVKRAKNVASTKEEEEHDSEQDCREEEVVDSESEESEYFSADETFPVLEERAAEAVADVPEDASNSDNDYSDEEEIFTSVQALSLCDNENGGRKRRPSKKQKRKRRLQKKEGYLYTYYAEYSAPFENAESIDVSIGELREELVSETDNVRAPVPSLFELCTKCLWSKNTKLPKTGYQLLPGPLKSAVSSYRQLQAFSSLQLSCLYRTLGELESKHTENDLEKVLVRNVWNQSCTLRNPERIITSMFLISEEEEATLVIPFMYASNGGIDAEFNYYTVDVRTSFYAVSLVASILDLMVPVSFRPTRKKEKSASNVDEEDQALVTCVKVVLAHLKKRYPDIIELVQHRALPYLYWIRGHNKLTLDQFLQLSNAAKALAEKAGYLLEAARFCQLQGQAESARRLFRQSHELLQDSPDARGNSRVREVINEQMLMLCANTYDQGVLDEAKAVQSLGAWQYLTTVPCAHAESYLAAAESVLCYHLSHLSGATVDKKLQQALKLVQACSRHCAAASSYLSLLHAWLGDRPESVKAFNRMIVSDKTPGLQFKPQNVYEMMFTPWQVLVDMAVQKKTVRVLPVVWRTQLGIFRVVKTLDVFEGDLHSQLLGLRLSPDGHLTGDLHLLLPSIRAVNLDLYTGKLILPSSPGQTYVHKGMLNSRISRDDEGSKPQVYSSGSYAMTSLEVYSDDQGQQIHLTMTGGSRVLKVGKAVAQLQFTSATGQRSRMSLKQVLKTSFKETLEKEIRESYPGSKNPQQVQALKGLEYGHKCDLYMTSAKDSHHIGGFVMQAEKEDMPAPSVRKEGRHHHYRNRRYRFHSHLPDSKSSKRALHGYNRADFEVKDFCTYGHTVCLIGSYSSRVFLAFVDGSSRQAFTSPVVFFPPVNCNVDINKCMLKVVGQQGHGVPRSDILCCTLFSSEDSMRVFGQWGKTFQNQTIDLPFGNCQCVLGSSVYSIENQGQAQGQQGTDLVTTLTELRVIQDNTELHVYDLDPEMREVKTVADRLLLVRSDGLRVLDPTTMLPEPLLCSPGSECQCPLSGDSMALLVNPMRVSVLAEKKVTSPTDSPTTMVPVAVNDFLVVFGVQERCSSDEPIVEIAFCVKIPGHATEACFIGQTVGYLVSTTMHQEATTSFYRETVCQLSPSGQLLSILPGLGPGPREFFPLLLPSQPGQEREEGYSSPGPAAWHVYMRDGHEGIISVRL